MSDDEFMMDSGDEDDYDYSYQSEDDDDDTNLENLYYTAKSYKSDDPEKAKETFKQIIELEEEKGDWGFKAHKQTLKLLFRENQYEAFISTYESLLTYVDKAVSRNYSTRSLTNILEYVSKSTHVDLLKRVYIITLDALKAANNMRLWFKILLKYGNLLLSLRAFDSLEGVIDQLNAALVGEEGDGSAHDATRDTQLMELYALEIQLYTEQKNSKKLKSLYQKSLSVRSAIPHPHILGIIRECGGKMHLDEGQFEQAYEDFFEAFKSYDESGSTKKIACLRYLVLANMLMKSAVDPFDAQESKPYRKDPDIVVMTDLVEAYQANNVKRFETVLRRNEKGIMGDTFMRSYVQELLKNVRIAGMTTMIKPYTRVRISFVAERLSISPEEVEKLLVSAILDGVICGKIDQAAGVVILQESAAEKKYSALASWADDLSLLLNAVLSS